MFGFEDLIYGNAYEIRTDCNKMYIIDKGHWEYWIIICNCGCYLAGKMGIDTCSKIYISWLSFIGIVLNSYVVFSCSFMGSKGVWVNTRLGSRCFFADNVDGSTGLWIPNKIFIIDKGCTMTYKGWSICVYGCDFSVVR